MQTQQYTSRNIMGIVWYSEYMRHIKVMVYAGAGEDRVIEKALDSFEVFVTAPARGGQANKSVLELLRGHGLGVGGSLRIVSGSRSPHKIVEVKV